MKVSIAIPVYGVERYIERCARSLFEQTYKDIEYIFVDDCTPDRSIEILYHTLKDYPERHPHVKIIINENNEGSASVRNTAVKASSGDFIMWVDSDDYIAKEAVELAVMRQQDDDYDIVSFNSYSVWPSHLTEYKYPLLHDTKEWTLKILAKQIRPVLWGRLIRLSLYKDNGVYFELGLNMGEDYHVMSKLSYFAKRMTLLEKSLYYYNRCNEVSYNSSFSTSKSDQVFEIIKILRNFFKDKGEDYSNALKEAEARVISEFLISTSLVGNRSYYNYLRKSKAEMISPKDYKRIQMAYRVAFYFKNYYLLRGYSCLGNFFKKKIRFNSWKCFCFS